MGFKRFIGGLAVLVLATAIPSPSRAADPHEHTFNPGEVISADVLNERFEGRSPNLAETIIGVWSSKCWDHTISDPSSPAIGTLTVNSLTDITHTGISCLSLGHASGDNVDPDFYALLSLTPIGNRALITRNLALFGSAGNIYLYSNPIVELTRNRIIYSTPNDGIEILTRVGTTPAIPTRLSSTSTGLTVSLSWTDASGDETSFKVFRKDTLSGAYAQVGTAPAGATGYVDVVPGAGTYWYRVRASNTNGDSLGSNVTKVTVTE